MNALTVLQPDAELIVRGRSTVQSRYWWQPLKGALLIHASQRRDYVHWFARYELDVPDDANFGAVVGVVDVVAACRADQVERVVADNAALLWLLRTNARGPYLYVLARPWRFARPIRCRGKRGIFTVPDELVGDELLLDENGVVRKMVDRVRSEDVCYKE